MNAVKALQATLFALLLGGGALAGHLISGTVEVSVRFVPPPAPSLALPQAADFQLPSKGDRLKPARPLVWRMGQ